MRKCDLLPTFRVTAFRPLLELSGCQHRKNMSWQNWTLWSSLTGILAAPHEHVEGVYLQDDFYHRPGIVTAELPLVFLTSPPCRGICHGGCGTQSHLFPSWHTYDSPSKTEWWHLPCSLPKALSSLSVPYLPPPIRDLSFKWWWGLFTSYYLNRKDWLEVSIWLGKPFLYITDAPVSTAV